MCSSDLGDAAISTFGMPHAGSRNELGPQKQQIIFRFQKNQLGKGGEVITTSGSGVPPPFAVSFVAVVVLFLHPLPYPPPTLHSTAPPAAQTLAPHPCARRLPPPRG